jgi:hypothetical protein
MPYKLSAVLGVAALALAIAVPANAFDCTVAKKPARTGAVGVVDITTGQFTPLKRNPGTEERPHGAFVALEGAGVSTSTFLHAPEGVLPPVRPGGAQDNCDGKGLDSLEQCFAGE